MTNQLIRYDAAIHALSECRAVDEVKDWHDKAAAMKAYGRIAKDKTLETDASEICIRAERRLGELLAASEKNTGAKGIGKSVVPIGNHTPTLAEAGIDKKLSARAQKIAAVSTPQFEKEVGEWRERVSAEGARVTARLETAGEAALSASKPSAKPEAAPDERDSKITALEEQLQELAANLQESNDDNASMAKVFDANHQLAAALAEAKMFREQARIAQSRIDGLMNEKNAALRSAKSWMNKFLKLEKESKAKGF